MKNLLNALTFVGAALPGLVSAAVPSPQTLSAAGLKYTGCVT